SQGSGSSLGQINPQILHPLEKEEQQKGQQAVPGPINESLPA
ncbi:hypothetical protein Tco_0605162, partial [Tanacetum coccineum]